MSDIFRNFCQLHETTRHATIPKNIKVYINERHNASLLHSEDFWAAQVQNMVVTMRFTINYKSMQNYNVRNK